jgi:hypothetical protein
MILNRVTTMFASTTTAAQRRNVFINWRAQGGNNSVDWEFDSNYVPLDLVFGTPSYPYRLKKKIELKDNYIDLKVLNNNAAAVTFCVAYFGRLLEECTLPTIPPNAVYKDYNYQVTDAVVGTGVTVTNGVATLPVAAPTFTGDVFFRNNYGGVFRMNKLWQWQNSALDTTMLMRLENNTIPLINRATYVDQIFGTPELRFDMEDELLMGWNEKLILTLSHTEVAPVAPYPVCFDFNGNLSDK